MTKYEKGFKAGYEKAKKQAREEYKHIQLIEDNAYLLAQAKYLNCLSNSFSDDDYKWLIQ
ncbi:hypothetical protein [Salmonella enterica]|uniref:hypothetical protein n=1 Tax=Salmonella enterica TaxID=28901 RepID=UPI00316747AC